MPINPNYQNSLIYKIVCNDTNIKEIYIGSTTNFRLRKSQHKSNCYNENDKQYNKNLYKFIRENGGFENWSMVLIDYTPCNSKLELHKIEREYIEKIDNELLLNQQIPSRTKEEYYETNKETILTRHKKYYFDNKEKNKEKVKEQQKKYRTENKEKCKERCKKYYETNKEKEKERKKEYYEANKDKIKEKQKEKVKCDVCNNVVSKYYLTKHKNSIKCRMVNECFIQED